MDLKISERSFLKRFIYEGTFKSPLKDTSGFTISYVDGSSSNAYIGLFINDDIIFGVSVYKMITQRN